MVQALHCQLSSPSFLDEAALGELLSRSLPNFKYENIFLTSTDTAIVWLPDDAKAEDFIDIGSVSLDESISASFLSGTAVRSRYLELTSSDPLRLLQASQTLEALDGEVLVFKRDSNAIISFPTRLAAADGFNALQTTFFDDGSATTVRAVTLAEHCFVTCEWKSSEAELEKTTLKHITYDNKTLTGFIQDALNLLGEKPLVLSVQKVPITMPRPDSVSTTKDVVFLHNSDDNYHTATIRSPHENIINLNFICPTQRDADILVSLGVIKLFDGSTVNILPVMKNSASTSLTALCQPTNPSLTYSQIVQKESKFPVSVSTDLSEIEIEESFLLLQNQNENKNKNTIIDLSTIVENEDESENENENEKTHERRMSFLTISAMDSVQTTAEHSPMKEREDKPKISFSSPKERSSKIESITFHSDDIHVSCDSSVDPLHSRNLMFNNSNDNSMFLSNHSILEKEEEREPIQEIQSQLENNQKILKIQTLVIESYMIANHIKFLMKWSSLEENFNPNFDSNLDSNSNNSSNLLQFPFLFVESSERNKTKVFYKSILGESVVYWKYKNSEKENVNECKTDEELDMSKDECNNYFKNNVIGHCNNENIIDNIEIDDNNELNYNYSSMSLTIDTKTKIHQLTVRARTDIEVKERIKCCEDMILILQDMHQRLPLKDWLPQHREAINLSEILKRKEEITKSTVLFHNSREKVISADVTSISKQSQIIMINFLQKLSPYYVEWLIPYKYISKYSKNDWNDIQSKYAIKINAKWKEMPQREDLEWSAHQNLKKCLKIWGFEPYVSKALIFVLTQNSDGSNSKIDKYININNINSKVDNDSDHIDNNSNSTSVLTDELISYIRTQCGTIVMPKELRRDKDKKDYKKERDIVPLPSTPLRDQKNDIDNINNINDMNNINNRNGDMHSSKNVSCSFPLPSSFSSSSTPSSSSSCSSSFASSPSCSLPSSFSTPNMYLSSSLAAAAYDDNNINGDDDDNDNDGFDYDDMKNQTKDNGKNNHIHNENENVKMKEKGKERKLGENVDYSSSSSVQSSNSKDQKTFRGQFAFQDRESGMFFQIFESEFRSYLSQTFGVKVTIPEAPVSRPAKTGVLTPPILVQRRSPLLKLELTANNKKDISSVKSYFEKFATHNFPRKQIYYPRCSGSIYREINLEKERNDNIHRITRSKFIEKINLSGSNNGVEVAVDPLTAPGFINIRMKPPMHSKGIRRMSLPTDLTVTICCPLYTESQKNDFNETYAQLAALDCQYVSSTVQLPLKTQIARTIAVRATRDTFITTHNLISLKWEENVRRKDVDCTGSSDDSSSTGSDGCGPCASSSSSSSSPDQIGFAKIWTLKTETMKKVLDFLYLNSNGTSIECGNGNTAFSSSSLSGATSNFCESEDANRADVNSMLQKKYVVQSNVYATGAPPPPPLSLPLQTDDSINDLLESRSRSCSLSTSGTFSGFGSARLSELRESVFIDENILENKLPTQSRFQEVDDTESVLTDMISTHMNLNATAKRMFSCPSSIAVTVTTSTASTTNCTPTAARTASTVSTGTTGRNRSISTEGPFLTSPGIGPFSTGQTFSTHSPIPGQSSGAVFNLGLNSGFGSRSLLEADKLPYGNLNDTTSSSFSSSFPSSSSSSSSSSSFIIDERMDTGTNPLGFYPIGSSYSSSVNENIDTDVKLSFSSSSSSTSTGIYNNGNNNNNNGNNNNNYFDLLRTKQSNSNSQIDSVLHFQPQLMRDSNSMSTSSDLIPVHKLSFLQNGYGNLLNNNNNDNKNKNNNHRNDDNDNNINNNDNRYSKHNGDLNKHGNNYSNSIYDNDNNNIDEVNNIKAKDKDKVKDKDKEKDISPSRITAAPGLSLPNDWEKIMKKVESSTPQQQYYATSQLYNSNNQQVNTNNQRFNTNNQQLNANSRLDFLSSSNPTTGSSYDKRQILSRHQQHQQQMQQVQQQQQEYNNNLFSSSYSTTSPIQSPSPSSTYIPINMTKTKTKPTYNESNIILNDFPSNLSVNGHHNNTSNGSGFGPGLGLGLGSSNLGTFKKDSGVGIENSGGYSVGSSLRNSLFPGIDGYGVSTVGLGTGAGTGGLSRTSGVLDQYSNYQQQQQQQQQQQRHNQDYLSSQQLQQQQQQQQLSRQGLGQGHLSMTANVIESRMIIHWPHPSFRFMFLGDPLKHQLSELLHKHRVRGVGITTPFRDKSNPTACLSLEGTSEGVATATQHVNAYFRSVAFLIRSVTMVLTAAQREKLTASDLTRVKEIQGTTGVHIILDPQPDDVSEAISKFDLRLPISESSGQSKGYNSRYGSGSTAIGSGDLNPASADTVPLITVRVQNQANRLIDVSVVTSINGAGNSTWGVNCVLLFIDSASYNALSQREKEIINRGEALVNPDNRTGKVYIRVKIKSYHKEHSVDKERSPDTEEFRFDSSDFHPIQNDVNDEEFVSKNSNDDGNNNDDDDFSHSQTKKNEIERQAGALVDAIGLGLCTADSLGLSGLALAPPMNNISLLNLSENVIKTLTTEAVISYLKNTTHFSIQRIVFININTIDNNDSNNININENGNIRVSNDVSQNHDILIQPACGNRVVYALLLILEQEMIIIKNAEQKREIEMKNRVNDPYSILNNHTDINNYNNYNNQYENNMIRTPTPTIRLIICNVPIPCALPALSIYPILHQQQQQQLQLQLQLQLQQRGNPSNLGYNAYDSAFLRSVGNGNYPVQPYGEYRYEEQGMIVIRGLSVGLLRAVRAIKSLVATTSISS